MSEQEKYEQVGRLAGDYSKAKGELLRVVEKLNSFGVACQVLIQYTNQNVSNALVIKDGQVDTNMANQYGAQPQMKALKHLLSYDELFKVLEERDRLMREVHDLTQRLRSLEPHLI